MAAPVVAVAYSGGRDSTALLHATLVVAREIGAQVHALHVHHGLQSAADDWLAHCESQCLRWARQGLPVRFHAQRLALKPRRGDSVEALAREARYSALAGMARAAGCELVLLAHHQRDQAETFVLQALRGAGPAGLAGMPRSALRDGITWARPWLDRPREAIEAYVRRHRLKHIDDASNDDARYARNRLRLAVWPQLIAAFPDAQASLADAAMRAAQALALADDVGRDDLGRCAAAHGCLDLKAWSALTPARGRNVLRAWLRERTGKAPAAALVDALCAQLPGAGNSAHWAIDAATQVERYRARLRVVTARPNAEREVRIAITRGGRHALHGWGGTIVAKKVGEGGVSAASLVDVELRERRGGERFQLGPGRPPRTLKKQFQSQGVAAKDRDAPLLYDRRGRLLFVPGLGIDARALAAPGEPQFALTWLARTGADR